MNKPVVLDKRLATIAALVPCGARIADIGTDHAWLPIFLTERGQCSYAVAADIGAGPLSKASANVASRHLEDKIKLVLTDGLQNIEPHKVDTIVIAGMGGETIADILTRSPWVRNSAVRLILQPMTSEAELREYLCNNGFHILTEHTAVIPPHYYIILEVQYDGVKRDASPLYCAIGSLTRHTDEDSAAYLKHKREVFQKMRNGLLKSGSQQLRAAEITVLLNEIDQRLQEF